MSRAVSLCAAGEIPVGGARRFVVEGHEPVAIFNLGGTLYATADKCSHQRASLSEGEVDGDEVICPLHFQVFHIPTGEAREGITRAPIATYAVCVDHGQIVVELP
jgi:nitrite reductase/ring-hydroxylating ferredoxin subunit